MQKYEQVQLDVRIGWETKSDIVEFKSGYAEKYNIDFSHPIELELVVGPKFCDIKDDEYFGVSWRDKDGGYCLATCSDPDIINSVCEEPIKAIAFIASAISNDDYEVEYDDEPAAPAPPA